MMMIAGLFLVYLFIGISSSSLCPHIAGQRSLPSNDSGDVNGYLNISDSQFTPIRFLLSFIANSDGTIDIIENGVIQFYYQQPNSVLVIPSSSISILPMHFTSNRQLYYSLSIISQNSTIIGPFARVIGNAGILEPGDVIDTTVELCCKSEGVVILEGCLTIGTQPFDVLGGQYSTIGPFYSTYHCEESSVRNDCEASLDLFIVISRVCFQQAQIQQLAILNQGSWGLLLSSFTTVLCLVDNGVGVIELLSNPLTNANFPVAREFPTLDLLLNRNARYNWDGTIGYSISVSSRDTSILDDVTVIGMPPQGSFSSENMNFSLNISNCKDIGVVVVDIYFNFSASMNGIIFNNSFHLYFHRNCTPMNYSSPVMLTLPLHIILPSSIIPVVTIVTLILVIITIISVITKRQHNRVKHLEQLAQQQQQSLVSSNNLYSLGTSPLASLQATKGIVEYNFALLEVVCKLGEGMFGNVYKARAPGLVNDGDNFVAVKTLKDNSTAEMIDKFVKEVNVCVEFDHPNVIRLLAVCTTSSQKCMIFQHMDLGSLDELLRSSDPNNPQHDPNASHLLESTHFLTICCQLASGLNHLSSLRFVHRDIAARNCLINSQFQVKLADFGLSRDLSAQDYYRIGDGNSFIPIRWMPPEALLYSKFTLQSDVWSFGVLMWEVYSYGQLPYTGLSSHEVIDCVKSLKILSKPSLCPLEVYDIMRSCWIKAPSKRPTIRQVLDHLDQYQRSGTHPGMHQYVNMSPNYVNLTSPSSLSNNDDDDDVTISTSTTGISTTGTRSNTGGYMELSPTMVVFESHEFSIYTTDENCTGHVVINNEYV
jgi:serine/threonine protein kinase